MLRTIRGKGDGRGVSGFAVNRGAVNRGFTVVSIERLLTIHLSLSVKTTVVSVETTLVSVFRTPYPQALSKLFLVYY